ncbi:MAG: bacterial Ig-like domain-containing protein, partial [Clostridia bacterium]|nr:bacterial Ig-like domain-containing protein [Clostridia bacterium]
VPGIKNVTVSYQGQSVSFPVKIVTRVITDFRLVSAPSKLEYIELEQFDPTGLKAEAEYNDGSVENVTDYEISGFMTDPGVHNVSVSYKGFVRSFTVNVVPRTLDGITVTVPDKTVYNIGEKFDKTGLTVKACYNNGQMIKVDEYTVSGFDSTSAGAKTVTVEYGGFSYSFAIVVRARSSVETVGKMTVGNIAGRPAAKVVIPVSVTNNAGIAGFTHTIGFDPSDLKFISAAAAEDYADGTVVINDDNAAKGKVTILWVGDADVIGDGEVYNLTFEILETAKESKTAVTISFADGDNGNTSGENVIFGKVDGYVDVLYYWLGDLNGDREYAMVDLLQLAQYVSGKEMTLTEKQMLSADVNEDGIIDIHDVIMLNQWLLTADM